MGSTTLPVGDIIQVNVTKQQAIKSLEDFGLLCVFTENTVIPEGEVREYADVESFDADFSAASSMKSYGDIFFAQNPVPTKLLVARVNLATADYPTTIEAVKQTNGFYAVGLDDNALDSATMQAIAAKVEELELLMIVSRDASDILTLQQTLTGLNNTRTALILVDDATVDAQRPDAAWFGVGLTRQAGAFNWANNLLSETSTTSESVSTVEALLNAFANVYVNVGTTELTRAGTTCATDVTYLDQIQAMDWLKINIEEAILNLLVSQDKIPYTDGGMKTLEAAVMGILKLGQQNGVLDPSYRISATAPSVLSVPVEQRAQRIAPTITASARLSGAINTIIVNVNVEI